MKSTLLKYILSYVVLFSIFIVGCLVLFERQIKPEVLAKDNQRRVVEIETVCALLDTQFTQLQQVANTLNEAWAPSSLEMSKIVYEYQVARDIVAQKEINFLLDEIWLFAYQDYHVVSTSYPVSYEEGGYVMHNVTDAIDLSVYPLFDYKEKQLFRAQGELRSYLYYLPVGQSSVSRVLFLLREDELSQYFQLGDSFQTIGLVNTKTGEILYQEGDKIETLGAQPIGADAHYQKMGESYLYLSDTRWNEYCVFGIESERELLSAQRSVFYRMYLTLIGFGIAGFLFICYALRITYVPLYQLTKRITKDTSKNENHIAAIDRVFKTEQENAQKLQDRLAQYQSTIQYHLLGDLFDLSHLTKAEQETLESVFQIARAHTFFLVKVMAEKMRDCAALQGELEQSFGADNICIALKQTQGQALLLLDDISQTQGKEEVLLNLLEELAQEYECNILVSNAAQDPKEIATLYANLNVTADLADVFATRRVVQFHQTLRKTEGCYGDRYRLIEQMDALFALRNFAELRERVQHLLQSLEDATLPEYYVKSILVELLTLICKHASQEKIQYETYQECYHEILNLVRHAQYLPEKEAVQAKFSQLLSVYEKACAVGTVSVESIKAYIQENYQDMNFSLSRLADEMQVSSAYLSFLYKKNTGMNLSEYVWEVRKQKMITLLKTTTLSIEQISVQVGYDNVSSLRRKFKQDTGKTPNQVRREE